MTPEETVGLLTWINQHDPRVQVNAAARDIWHFSLSAVHLEDARQAIMDHTKVNDSIVVNPSTIYKRAKAIQTSREASSRARMIGATPHATAITNPRALRSRNPELWDKLFEEGRKQGNEDRARNAANLAGTPAPVDNLAHFSYQADTWNESDYAA